MNETSKETLDTIERMLIRNFTSPHDAIHAAYRLGRLDGLSQMAKVGQEAAVELLGAANEHAH